ncbi:hypothetical protein AA23498_0534 [Acetobacter nitrogenifigens DSM 23921 = NBRC 105050]|uniref:Uncharacterized protein n=1 Tax=Acetobacter nitrogenifigens DSM 23921 = NBRC 105050 TaxID=1120919 RepID=A0A511X7X9_9PROT|nr:hypothetical protein AA23498_0534 [Acetobacter nitrogenifigens DSM 23921 = NBRC 105050]GEN59056.1 hypothetical protein ANI02nite_09400 [Acetobacter nitrogenifigens DSM 23921 = NBRC 105050]
MPGTLCCIIVRVTLVICRVEPRPKTVTASLPCAIALACRGVDCGLVGEDAAPAAKGCVNGFRNVFGLEEVGAA